jgi:hypothetical protein
MAMGVRSAVIAAVLAAQQGADHPAGGGRGTPHAAICLRVKPPAGLRPASISSELTCGSVARIAASSAACSGVRRAALACCLIAIAAVT